jgi:signal transduction histidine kinase
LVVSIFVDRATEVRTLWTLLLALVVGGVGLMVAAVSVGYIYSGAALVPIRNSLRRQREFTADASHELRTPLSIVGAAVEQLRRDHDDAAAIERTIDDIEIGTGRLTRLIDDLLLLARSDSDTVELTVDPADLADVAADGIAGLVAVAARAGVRLRLDVVPAPVLGDEAHLGQLAVILVDNAIRQSPKGGTVLVRVRPGASLEVEDEGPGIRAEDLPHIFDRFWRAADAPIGGTGLGLAIATWIADRHGGRLVAENRPQGGSCLRFSMPAAY